MLKKLDYKNMKLVYQHAFCKLIRVSEDGKHNLEPLIFIEDQVNRLTQYLENKYGMNKNSCYRYQNYFEYDDEKHTPYIFLYDYPLKNVEKSLINNEVLANELKVIFELLKLENITIMGIGNGGMIGTLTSTSKRVKQVIAMHSPIFGIPLLKDSELSKISKEMDLSEKIIYNLTKIYLNDNYGFFNIEKVGDLAKIIYTGSDIIQNASNNKLANYLALMYYHLLGYRTDGVVITNQDKIKSMGLNYIEEKGISHFEIGSTDYTNAYYEKLVRKSK